MELKITKERILEAAAKCSQAKDTLKTLFPEAFEEDKKVSLLFDDLKIENRTEGLLAISDKKGQYILQTARKSAPGGYEGKCFILGGFFTWDLTGLILTPKRR